MIPLGIGLLALLLAMICLPAIGQEAEGVAAEDKPTLEQLQEQAKAGEWEAMFALGERYEEGEGVEKNIENRLQVVPEVCGSEPPACASADRSDVPVRHVC